MALNVMRRPLTAHMMYLFYIALGPAAPTLLVSPLINGNYFKLTMNYRYFLCILVSPNLIKRSHAT